MLSRRQQQGLCYAACETKNGLLAIPLVYSAKLLFTKPITQANANPLQVAINREIKISANRYGHSIMDIPAQPPNV